MSLPRLKKIVVNMGVGAAISEKKYLEEAVDAMKLITGQKPVVTKARKSIAGFKLREGMAIGCKVTLRGKRMYEFLDRLISLALPRVRDFRGLNPTPSTATATTASGLTEQLVFPELNPDKYTRTQGMNITVVTSTESDDEARELLRRHGHADAGGRRAACRQSRVGDVVGGYDEREGPTECMASKSKFAMAARAAEVLHPCSSGGAGSADGRGPCTGSSGSAGSASAIWPTKD